MQRLVPMLTFLSLLMGSVLITTLLTAGLFADPPAGASPAPAPIQPESATGPPVSVRQALDELLAEVEKLEPSRFTGGRKKLFASRLETAIHRLERGHELAAASQLRSLLRTTDGCIPTGRPDRNDWILDCETQEALHRRLLEAKRGLSADKSSR